MMIKIEQGFYGDIGKSHGCIAASNINSSLNSFLTAFTDRPGAIPAGITMEPYLSGVLHKDKYIFTKTFPDTEASRGGMVFTHALIVEVSDLAHIHNLNDIWFYLTSRILRQPKPEQITFQPSAMEKEDVENYVPQFTQQTIQNIIEVNHPVLFCGPLVNFQKAIQLIWAGLPFGLKKNFSFTAGFSNSPIDQTKTIIYFQKNLYSVLKNLTFVDGHNNEKVSITSEVEKFLLFKNSDNQFEEFLKKLDIQLIDWSTLTPTIKAFQLFQKIDSTIGYDETRLLLRNVAKISPTPNAGNQLKDKIIAKLSHEISFNDDGNIKSLKNLDLLGFKDAEQILGNAIKLNIFKTLHSENNFDFQIIEEVFNLSIIGKPKWWCSAVLDGFATSFKKPTSVFLSNFWQIILNFKSDIKSLLQIIPNDKTIEKGFIKKKPDSIDKLTAKNIASLIQDKKWFLLHAELLLQYLSLPLALKKQLEFEKTANSIIFAGSNFLLSKFSDKECLDLALETNDDFIIAECAKRSIKNATLLHKLNTSEAVWLRIWSASITLTNDLEHGITNLANVVNNLIELIAVNIKIPDRILSSLADSEYNDLSGYVNLSAILVNLPEQHKNKFLQSTANGCLDKIINGRMNGSTLHPEIASILASDEYMTVFLSKNRANIDSVISVFFNISGLKDDFFSNYIKYYSLSLSELQSSKLGSVILTKRFTLSARQIFEKAKYDRSYAIALNICKSLISFGFFEKLLNSNLLGEVLSVDSFYSEILNMAQIMYPKGPEDNDIWKRAGGDVSKLVDSKSRAENWKLAIHNLKNGGAGSKISTTKLLDAMIEDHPYNNELKELKKYFK